MEMPFALKRIHLKILIYFRTNPIKAILAGTVLFSVCLLLCIIPFKYLKFSSPLLTPEKQHRHVVMNRSVPSLKLDKTSQDHDDMTSLLKTVVVDEHHMVLPHWYAIAQELKLTNFTLIHIDGHIDMAPPVYFNRLFEWPKSSKHITLYMQRNDVFVVGAMATGLINSFVWVWPEWTRVQSAKEFGDYTEAHLNIGYFHYREENKILRRGTCMCIIESDKTSTGYDGENKEWESCIFFTSDMNLYEDDKVKCSPMRKSVEVQVMSMKYALKHGVRPLTEKGGPQPVILDIDEDYWGCERGSDIIERSGINWNHIEIINHYLHEAILPKTIQHETEFNEILKSLVHHSTCDNKSEKCTLDPSSIGELEKSGCLKDGYSSALASAMKIIKSLTNWQQYVIKMVGFCLETSPTTSHIQLGHPNAMRVCTGASIPGSNNSVFFTPDVRRVESDMKDVFQLLDELDFKKLYNLNLITVARSLRDKYTPLDFQQRIEEGILAILKQIFNAPPVKYDATNLQIYQT